MLALLALVASALATTVEVVTPEGPLRPGRPAPIEVAVADPRGKPLHEEPEVRASAGVLRPLEARAPGVYRFVWTPPAAVGEVDLEVSALGERIVRTLPVIGPEASGLALPGRVDADAGDSEVRFRITGADLPPPEALQVVVGSRASVLGVEAVDGALEVRVAPGGDGSARFVPIGVRDARSDTAPAWGGFRLRKRLQLVYDVDHPGTVLEVSIGRRRYGPFTADASGTIRGHLDQYPGESSAQAIFRDDLGNETRTALPLSSRTEPALVALPAGRLVVGRAPPPVFLRGTRGDGSPWDGDAPGCRTPAADNLPVTPIGPGEWLVGLPDDPGATEHRVRCTLREGVETSFRVRAAERVPARIGLRIWPEELNTDFPVAEVQVSLEDARGERLAVDGLEVAAEWGEIAMEPPSGFVARGEYRGARAVAEGEDVVRAVYRLPMGKGLPAAVDVRHGPVPEEGTVEVHARVLDREGRPIGSVPLALGIGGPTVEVETGPAGWATATIPLPPGRAPVVFEARTRWRSARAVALRGSPTTGGPGESDLVAERRVRLTPGRVADVRVTVTPSLLYTGRGSVALLRVRLLDRAGSAIADESVQVEVDHGQIAPLRVDDDGTWIAEYEPPLGDRPRTVHFTARSEGRTGNAQLDLVPRPVTVAIGLGLGWTSNFGALSAPYLAVDVDWSPERLGERVILRFGVARYQGTADVETGVGEPVQVRTTLIPITAGAGFRQDLARGRCAAWAGGGVLIAPHQEEARFEGTSTSRTLGILAPGAGVFGGGGCRIGRSELFGEVRASWLSSPGGDAAFEGPVGGVAPMLGYRVIY